MPPRISVQSSLKAFTGSTSGYSPLSNSINTSIRAASSKAQVRRKHDPFMMAQARQRKAANVSRQQVLAEERGSSLGDPVKSQPTPFIQEMTAIQTNSHIQSSLTGDLNYYLKSNELDAALDFSKDLTAPLKNPDRNTADPQVEKEAMNMHSQEHKNAQEAINRIVNLNNGNTKDRVRLNITKCIETFGRHYTDSILPPKPKALVHGAAPVHPERAPRVGPDTGSAEVQAAILTVKIMNLSRHLENANKDKHNKRNLQLLVHKRAKLLQYVRKKERGGPRWQNLMGTLGLSDAAWKGEIAI
ncbi:Ribosomal protein S15 [Penicillium cf. griseofulvum]|uniref:Ribosomal protein S15 n=1 Tax=Penicillium cf. griseofulvum TaxID=2972120 RepID=A0A9W9N175_9EURO|nr:Ribosomal protein S15 [Penicillium cf. griseofulvum]KAJ5422662.1 Ribosomal protein S15 [Penicillium cf. griseofulvum]